MFGALIIGPSGSGKTTFCYGLSQFFSQIERKCVLVNLDPANDNVPYNVFYFLFCFYILHILNRD
jgi:GPN-loop GTPase